MRKKCPRVAVHLHRRDAEGNEELDLTRAFVVEIRESGGGGGGGGGGDGGKFPREKRIVGMGKGRERTNEREEGGGGGER